jgi:hypothetical protein
MSTPAKDAMIESYRKEEDDVGPDYNEWLEHLITDINEEYVAQLEARMTDPSSHKETVPCQSLPPIPNTSNIKS